MVFVLHPLLFPVVDVALCFRNCQKKRGFGTQRDDSVRAIEECVGTPWSRTRSINHGEYLHEVECKTWRNQ